MSTSSTRLEHEFPNRSKDYIEKIVQLELALPKIEAIMLGRIVQSYLENVEKQTAIALLSDSNFHDRIQSVFNPHLIQLLDNIRLIKLIINRFLLAVPLVKGEINYFDLLMLEIVRLKQPTIFEAIFHHREYFSYRNAINWALNGADRQRTEDFFNAVFSKADESDKEAILSLLGAVFNSVHCYHKKENIIWDTKHDEKYRAMKSAAHPYYFPRYFYLAVQQGVFPDVAWDTFITDINTLPENEVGNLINVLLEEMRRTDQAQQWLDRMRTSVRSIEQNRIPIVLSTIVSRSNEFTDSTAGFFEFSEYRLLLFLVIDLLEQVTPAEVEDLVIHMIQESPDVEFIRELFMWFDPAIANAEQVELKFKVSDFDNLKRIAAARLRAAYIEDRRNILEESHHFGGLYALNYFLSSEECKSYIENLILRNALNALLLLKSLVSKGHSTNGIQTTEFRILNYSTIESFVAPEDLYQILSRLEPARFTNDDLWAIEACTLA